MKFEPRPVQRDVVETLQREKWLYLLKSRQMGGTTALAWYFFRKALTKPNFRVLVIAHTRETAEEIFRIYQRFHEHLPRHLKFRTVSDTRRNLEFAHGGRICVTTAGSGEVAGTTWSAIHGSEFARWNDIPKAVGAIMQAATDGAEVVLETTAEELNEAYDLWTTGSAWHRMFLAWTRDPTYVSDDDPPPSPDPDCLRPHEVEYIRTHGLTRKRANWFVKTLRTKCFDLIATFNQQYPITAELAFVTAGTKFFTRIWGVGTPVFDGLVRYAEPTKNHVYCAGIDTASGSPDGARSVVVVLDVTDKKKITIAASLGIRVPPNSFSDMAYGLVNNYRALAVIESNASGVVVIERFVNENYEHLYVRDKPPEKIGDPPTSEIGWLTNERSRLQALSRLNQMLTAGTLEPDDRLMSECNSFTYSASGKPQKSSGRFDDFVLATSFATMGLDQAVGVTEERQERKQALPTNVRELLEYEACTGRLFSVDELDPRPSDVFDYD